MHSAPNLHNLKQFLSFSKSVEPLVRLILAEYLVCLFFAEKASSTENAVDKPSEASSVHATISPQAAPVGAPATTQVSYDQLE